jgi:hypothetical protein
VALRALVVWNFLPFLDAPRSVIGVPAGLVRQLLLGRPPGSHVALINSRPRTPTREEIAEIIARAAAQSPTWISVR